MAAVKDERDRVLSMLAAGQINTEQASRLLDIIEIEPAAHTPQQQHIRDRVIRLRTTSLGSKDKKINFTASLPVAMLKIGLRLGGILLPQLQVTTIQSILRAIETGRTGLILDLQDLEHGERLEIFID